MHDAKGRPLTVGDTVLVPCKVVTLMGNEEYCNVNLVQLGAMFPEKRNDHLTINTKACLRANEGDETAFTVVQEADGTTSLS